MNFFEAGIVNAIASETCIFLFPQKKNDAIKVGLRPISLDTAREVQLVAGLRVGRVAEISHLQFADDTIFIFSKDSLPIF